MRIPILEAPRTWKDYFMHYLVIPGAGIVLTLYVGFLGYVVLYVGRQDSPNVTKAFLTFFGVLWLIGFICAIWPIVSAVVRRNRREVAAG